MYRWIVIDRFNLSRLTEIYLLLLTPPPTLISFYLHRYYLEPASPLKSITNTAQLAPSQKQQLNSATILTNGTGIKTIEENAHNNLWASSSSNPITNGNGNTNTNGNSHKTNDLTNGRWKLDLLSSDDNNTSLFTNHSSVAKTNGNGQPINGFATMNGGSKAKDSNSNGISSSSSISRPVNKNGFHLPPPGTKIQIPNGHNANLFTPDSDFVADFGSANIFDALNQKPSINNTNNNINNNNNNTTSANKSIQLNGVKHSNGIEMSNGNGNHQMNGNGNNHFADVNKNVDENFADFEHNTIYNAAGEFD